jgi:hypothetical protein
LHKLNLARRSRQGCVLLAGLVLSAAVVVVLPGVAHAGTSNNLIKNGSAERGLGSTDGGIVPVPFWTLAQGTSFTAVQYGASGGFPTALDKGPKNRRANFFAGGPGDVGTTEIVTQTVDVSRYAGTIDLGVVDSMLIGWLGGNSAQADNAMLEVDWYSATGAPLGATSVGPVTNSDRNNKTSLLQRTATAPVPIGTRSGVVKLILTRVDGTYNDGYADSLVLKLLHI